MPQQWSRDRSSDDVIVYSEMGHKEEVVFELEQWAKEMKERGRQLLTYHLNRLGMRHIANK